MMIKVYNHHHMLYNWTGKKGGETGLYKLAQSPNIAILDLRPYCITQWTLKRITC